MAGARTLFRFVVLGVLGFSILMPTQLVLSSSIITPQTVVVTVGENTNTPPSPRAGQGYSYSVNAKGLTTPGAGLPAGLGINSKTGVISGAVAPAVQPGTYKPQVSVTSPSVAAGVIYTIVVERKIVLGDVLARVQPGETVHIAPKVIGAQLSNFRLANKPKTKPGIGYPKGLSIDSKTGVLFGTVAYEVEYGIYNFLVWADEIVRGTKVSHFAYYTLLVSPKHFSVDEQNIELQVQKPFRFALTANGAAVGWTAKNLPRGVYLTGTGLLFGVPAVPPGEYTAELTAYGLEYKDGALALVSVTTHLNILFAGAPNIEPQSITVKKGESVNVPPKPAHRPGWVYWPNQSALVYPGNGLPDGLILSPDNGTLYGAVSPAVQPGVYTPTIFKAVPGQVEYRQHATYTITVLAGDDSRSRRVLVDAN